LVKVVRKVFDPELAEFVTFQVVARAETLPAHGHGAGQISAMQVALATYKTENAVPDAGERDIILSSGSAR
jgi:hypothetical protein